MWLLHLRLRDHCCSFDGIFAPPVSLRLPELTMPELISVTEFIDETNEDYKAPTTSNFTTRMGHCRNAVGALEEVRKQGHTHTRLEVGDYKSLIRW